MLKNIQIRKLTGQRKAIKTELYGRYELHRKIMGHLSSVYCVCFDQTGEYIFTGADDHLIKVWSARTGRLLKTLRGHDGEITDMSVNFENRLLASGGMDRVIRIWDLKTSKLLECLNTHKAMVTSVEFSPYNRHGDDRYLISTSNDGTVIFWVYHKDKFQFKQIHKFRERNRPGGKIVCSSHSVGGSFLACGSSDNSIHVYGFHPVSGPYRMEEKNEHKDQVDSIKFCNYGFRFITGSQDGTAIIWNFKLGEFVPLKLDMNTQMNQRVCDNHNGENKQKVLIVQWSTDDQYVMTSTADFSIKVWNSKSGKLVHILREHSHDVYLLEAHPTDPRIFISASHDGTMIIWDIERGKIIRKFHNIADPLNLDPIQQDNLDQTPHTQLASIYDVKFSPDGLMIAATDSHGYLSLYGFGSAESYKDLPEQMFFNTDYRALIRDMRNFVLDEQTHIAPHLMPRPTLVDMNGDPHPERYQRLVPDYKDGERIVIKPLSDIRINTIAELIANHSRQEDDEFLEEKRGCYSKRTPQRLPQRRQVCTYVEEDDGSTTEADDDDQTIIDSDDHDDERDDDERDDDDQDNDDSTEEDNDDDDDDDDNTIIDSDATEIDEDYQIPRALTPSRQDSGRRVTRSSVQRGNGSLSSQSQRPQRRCSERLRARKRFRVA